MTTTFYQFPGEKIPTNLKWLLKADWTWECLQYSVFLSKVLPGSRNTKSNDYVIECFSFEFDTKIDRIECKVTSTETRCFALDTFTQWVLLQVSLSLKLTTLRFYYLSPRWYRPCTKTGTARVVVSGITIYLHPRRSRRS